MTDIVDVVPVGGQTRTPALMKTIREIFGRDPNRSVNPDEVVAIGASIQTGIVEGEVTDLVLLDVTPHTLGIETTNGTFTRIATAPFPRRTVVSSPRSWTISPTWKSTWCRGMHIGPQRMSL